MRVLKKITLVMIYFLFANCTKKNIKTNINQIDSEYTFLHYHNDEIDSTHLEFFYNNNAKDSTYIIATIPKDNYIFRGRGWTLKEKQIGDWYCEKVYKDNVVIDSILNYVLICDKSHLNTKKIYKNGKVDKNKGFFYEVDMKDQISVGDTLSIEMNFFNDTIVFDKRISPLILFKPENIKDYCNFSEFSLDTLPIINNTTSMKFLIEEKGKVKILGYYYLFPKKQPKDSEMTDALQVFTEIDFEVK